MHLGILVRMQMLQTIAIHPKSRYTLVNPPNHPIHLHHAFCTSTTQNCYVAEIPGMNYAIRASPNHSCADNFTAGPGIYYMYYF